MRRTILIAVAYLILPALGLILPALGFGQALTDQQIVERIIQENRHAYYAGGYWCACPDDIATDGGSCGGRSAYTDPGNAHPKCYPRDVTDADIEGYRTRHLR
jgi:hypothetical protein